MSAITVLEPSGTEVSQKTFTEKSPTLIELDTSQADCVYPYPTDFKIHEHTLDETRELKVQASDTQIATVN
ncbi:unnamed protein product [Aureobasidium uvarum]|uniref:Uncharacterized protein n=1 Tax=Aureobasidium uvarum TaxID=2773716 RepID=A0A9N8KEE4_9PEZI|nr:unnamed protein product [Aureobasidium uvarum]